MMKNTITKTIGLLLILGLTACASGEITGTAELNPEIEPALKADASAARTSAPKQKAQEPKLIETVSVKASRTGEVYLMRGLLNVFSRGMDTMAGRLRAKGVRAVSFNHGSWKKAANEIIIRDRRKQLSYPVIIMGHSLGGNEASRMASYLGRNGVKVGLVVAFDPTVPGTVSGNIGDVINYYLPNDRHDNVIRKDEKFTGKLENINVTNMGVSHTTIEKNYRLQDKAIAKVMKITKSLEKEKKTKSRRKSRKKRRG